MIGGPIVMLLEEIRDVLLRIETAQLTQLETATDALASLDACVNLLRDQPTGFRSSGGGF